MKKIQKIHIIVTIITFFITFNINVQADTTMHIKCDTETEGEVNFVRLTDNKGEYFFVAAEIGIDVFSTIPHIDWGSDSEGTTIFEPISKFDKGVCPREMAAFSNAAYLLIGESRYSKISFLENPRYIIYSYNDNGNKKIIAEGYNANGAYAFIGPDPTISFFDEVALHQTRLIGKNNENITNYFKIDENFDKLLIAGNGILGDYSVCEEKSKDSCVRENGFEIIVASKGEGRDNIQNVVNSWLERNNGELSGYNNIISLSQDEEFISTCERITESVEKGIDYNFENDNLNKLITTLESGISALDEAYSVEFRDCATNKKTSVTSAITSCVVYSDMLGIKEFVEIAEEKDSENMINQGFIIEELYSDVSESLEVALANGKYDINIIRASSQLNEYTKLFYTTASYLYSKAKKDVDGLEEYESRLKDIDEGYFNLVNKHKLGIYPVVDCETLIGEDLKIKIQSYTNIIKIVIPIILIILGTIDFSKAMFAGEEEMKSARNKFIKRLAIAILIFLTPTIVNLLLTIANKVWSIFSPDSCGIF